MPPATLWQTLSRIKPIQDLQKHPSSPSGSSQSLTRSLTLPDLLLYGVGSSVGAGIYSLVGVGAAETGPAISLSFLFCGVACIFTSLSYSEFAARVPVAGSAYTFVYASFGEFLAWLVGWNLTLGYGVSAAVVARSWSSYLVTFLAGLPFGIHSAVKALHEQTIFGLSADPLAAVLVLACTAVLCLGGKESTTFNSVMTCLNLGVLSFVVLFGSAEVSSDNFVPFASDGFSGVAKGAGLVFFAYLGFDMVACLAEEVQNPQRDMPRGIIGSLIISMCVYVSLSLVVVGMSPIPILGPTTPLTNAFIANACCSHEAMLADVSSHYSHSSSSFSLPTSSFDCLACDSSTSRSAVMYYGSRLINVGALFGLTTACFTCLMGQPRIFYRMSIDGLLPSVFSKVSEKTKVPIHGTVVTGLAVAAIAVFVPLDALANMISLGTLQVFTFVNAGVVLLRLHPYSSTGYTGAPSMLLTFCLGVLSLSLILAGADSAKSVSSKSADRGAPVVSDVLSSSSSPPSQPLLGRGALLLCALCVCASSAAAVFKMELGPAPRTFRCPAVPLVPLLGIACNTFMMGSMDARAWSYMGVWTAAGVGIYATYGAWNSKLRGREGSGEGRAEERGWGRAGQDGYGSVENGGARYFLGRG